MKPRALFLAAALALLPGLPALAQSPLVLEARANGTAVVAEPVLVELSLANPTEDTVAGIDLRPGFGVQVGVARDAAGPAPFTSKDFRDSWREERGYVEILPLAPGEVRTSRFSLSWDASRESFVLDQAGHYRIEIAHPELSSAWIEIDVAEPAGADAEALEWLRARSLSALISEDAVHSIWTDNPRYPDLETFADLHGGSAYGPGVRRALLALGAGVRLGGDFTHRWEPGPSGESLSVYVVNLHALGSRPVRVERIELAEGSMRIVGPPELPMVVTRGPGGEIRLVAETPTPDTAHQELVIHSDDWSGEPLRIEVWPFMAGEK